VLFGRYRHQGMVTKAAPDHLFARRGLLEGRDTLCFTTTRA